MYALLLGHRQIGYRQESTTKTVVLQLEEPVAKRSRIAIGESTKKVQIDSTEPPSTSANTDQKKYYNRCPAVACKRSAGSAQWIKRTVLHTSSRRVYRVKNKNKKKVNATVHLGPYSLIMPDFV